ncbi:uncharacterized protein LOC120085312 isoform X2 [Benincasa hispida]|uniref:uncharacterized protein LOC120085312 isoform X2 n=1 Tax=Benincasa hispida TaxID=102211 RepID=UPI001900A3B3|nr:uncharacterized protein LOC120085312 isoform X2 [Benincasa hispida]
MSGEAKRGGATGGAGGFRSRMEHYLYSGEKKHVAAGIVVIGIIFGIPWVLMNRGSKHQSHQDYMEKADKARSQRLSSVAPAISCISPFPILTLKEGKLYSPSEIFEDARSYASVE